MERLWSLRGIILSLTAIIIVCIYFLTASTIPSPQLQVIRLSQIYAFLATIYLYAALLVSPLYTVFPYLPLRIWYTKARRAIGVSAFFFALIHTYFAFFGQLGGFSGLFYLSNNFLVPVLLGFTALTILLILTLTSFDKAIAHLTFTKWKKLHRTVYLAALISVIHALLLGTHYQDLSTLIPRITIALLAILLLLESIRFDRYLHKHFTQLPQCGIALTCTICLIIGYLVFSFAPSSSSVSFNVHAQHIQLAKQAQSGTLLPAQAKGIPGFNGDPTLRYTASFLPEPPVVANTPTKLTFKIYNAATGDEIKLFSRVYTKLIHLVIVNESLTYFSHIHPVQTDAGFE
ncbi:MAG TPA: ferric reductase-like transmembrane domain-containing protein, partial [Patescibacteria group bacterium]|nr:ferric reductase-like transmembrane domain-containing protein [Patescibacteria group bacterium]